MNAPAERLAVVLRQSPDWHALARGGAHDGAAFDALIGRPAGTTAALIAFWDAAFATGFFAARARMKEIALAALRRVGEAEFATLETLRPPYDDKALYAFTDDDDWFAPDLAAALLGSAAAAGDGVVWTSTRFDGALLTRPNDGFCYTNNYAVHGGFLNRCGETAPLLMQHMGAQGLLHGSGVTLARLDAPLSVTNKHPCATVTLERAKRGELDLEALRAPYRAFLERRRAGRDGADAVAWARPMMAEVAAFFADLRPRGPQSSIWKRFSRTVFPSRSTE